MNRQKLSVWQEARQMMNLTVPTVIVQIGSTLPPLLIASCVGKQLGSVYLDAFTLASLTGNLCTLALISGLNSASDTLSPQAFGAGNYNELGLLAIRGFTVTMLFVIPINLVLILFMEKILLAFGQDPELSFLASQWYQIYVMALPFYALYTTVWKFLSAQEIMVPLVVVLLLTLFMLPGLLKLLLPLFGFAGSALAILIYQLSQVVLLLGYLWWHKPHQEGTWPGLGAWKVALQWQPFKSYLSLGMGGILSASEWIYWEVLGLLVGTLGQTSLAVHTVPTQVIAMAFMLPLGIGIALSIRLGQTLPRSVKRAKRLVAWTFGFTTCLVTIVSASLHVFRASIFQIFTTEQEILDGCDRIWPQVVVYSWTLSIFALCMGVASGLGMQWTLGAITFCVYGSWDYPACGSLPFTEKGALKWHGIGSIHRMWQWMLFWY